MFLTPLMRRHNGGVFLFPHLPLAIFPIRCYSSIRLIILLAER